MSEIYDQMVLPDRAELFSVVCSADDMPAPDVDAPHVVVCAEETGGTDALLPVLHELHMRNIGTTAIVAGNGLRVLNQRGPRHSLRLSEPLAEWPEAAMHPSALLITPSEDGRLERDIFARFGPTPAVVIEDYYESGRRSVESAVALGLLPPTICILEQEAERLIRNRFPDVPVPVELTGSPTFDPLAYEDAAALRAKSRTELDVPVDKTLIAFLMPRLGDASLRLAGQVAAAFQQMDGEYTLIPRRHPSDTISQTEYNRIFDGIPTLDTAGIPTDTITDATDLVIAHRSVTALREAVRQRPTITLNVELAPGFTFPLVDTGASLPAQPDQLPELIPEILHGTSPRCEELRQNMLRLKTDGRAALRVADVVCRAMQPATNHPSFLPVRCN